MTRGADRVKNRRGIMLVKAQFFAKGPILLSEKPIIFKVKLPKGQNLSLDSVYLADTLL